MPLESWTLVCCAATLAAASWLAFQYVGKAPRATDSVGPPRSAGSFWKRTGTNGGTPIRRRLNLVALTGLALGLTAMLGVLMDSADSDPSDRAWFNPFRPSTSKPARAASAERAIHRKQGISIPLRADLAPDDRMTVNLSVTNTAEALAIFADITGRQLWPRTNGVSERLDDLLHGQLSRWKLLRRAPIPDVGVSYHRDGFFTASEVKDTLEALFKTNGIALEPVGRKYFRVRTGRPTPGLAGAEH